MTAPATPMLDKAAVEELTGHEIRAALRELKALDPDGADYGLQICNRGACVVSGVWQMPVRWLPSVEDALIAKRADLLEIAAEIEAGA